MKSNAEIAGGIDLDPAKIGCSLTGITGIKGLESCQGVSSFDELLRNTKPDVVLDTQSFNNHENSNSGNEWLRARCPTRTATWFSGKLKSRVNFRAAPDLQNRTEVSAKNQSKVSSTTKKKSSTRVTCGRTNSWSFCSTRRGSEPMNEKTKTRVRERAARHCEYWRLSQSDSPLAALHIEQQSTYLIGKTAIGRTTIPVLNMNSEDQPALRSS